ncbi:MAG: PspA/IM30 family protein [Thiohalocapsa sp.]
MITRLSRLMRADLNAVLDRLEEPDILLSQALRDMQEAVASDERTLASLRRDQRRLRERRDSLSQRQSSTAAELAVCLDAGQDDLARALLRRQLEDQRLNTLLTGREQDLGARIEDLTEVLDQRLRRLETLQAEAALVMETRKEEAGTRFDPSFDGSPAWESDAPAPVRDTDVEVALLAAKRRRSS